MDAPRINLADSPDFDLGGLRVSPAHREVRKGEERRDLEPKVAQVLVALVSADGKIVSRDRLIEQCWDGRIVGDDAINRCIVALRHLAKQFTPEPFTIKTVPRVGYELEERTAPLATRSRNFGSRPVALIAAVFLVLLIASAAVLLLPRGDRGQAAPASIALVPFRNLSNDNPYFAEGIGEEILAQLSAEPQFRVAGRASSSELGSDADPREVARRLAVDYIIEGSVRRQGQSVRVNASLVRASDGSRLWSESYDGKLDDIFAIQQRIGSAVAAALRRKLVRAAASGSFVTNGEAYNLYLTARGLIRTRKRDVFVTSANLLRDAISIDPNYAPAWASLAESIYLQEYPNGSEGLIAELPRAQRYARRALQLAPDLADGHRVLALLLPMGSPDALAHFQRAVELDGNSAENLIALGIALGNAGEFNAEMAAYGRARVVDPAWFRTTGQLAIRLAEMGRRADAVKVAERGFVTNQSNLHILLGRIAWIFGDFSEAGRQWSIVARANSPRWSHRARIGVEDVKVFVGIEPGRPGYRPAFPSPQQRGDINVQTPPSSSEWKLRNRSTIAADVYRHDNHVAAKLMLNSGRAKELVTLYDDRVGLLSIHPKQRLRADQLHEVAVVLLALRQEGRSADANRLLAQATALISSIEGASPFSLDADIAAIWAVQGKRDQALDMLDRARRRGWTNTTITDLPDIADEPAFESLHGHPRFQRMRAALMAHLARERAETIQLRI